MRAAPFLVAALATLSPLQATAQLAIAPGERVRVESRHGAVLVGLLSAVESESIILSGLAGEEVTIPFAETESIERSLGRRRSFGRNFALTVGLSSAAVGLGSALLWFECEPEWSFPCELFPDSRSGTLAWGIAGGALVGIPLGVLVGLVVKREQWEQLSVPGTETTTFSIAPVVGSRFGVSASITLGRQ